MIVDVLGLVVDICEQRGHFPRELPSVPGSRRRARAAANVVLGSGRDRVTHCACALLAGFRSNHCLGVGLCYPLFFQAYPLALLLAFGV